MAPELQVLHRVVAADRFRQAALLIAPARNSPRIGQRAVVLDDALQGFPGQIEAVEIRIAPFQLGDDAQRLRIVVEAAVFPEASIERPLTGMPERRMAEVMRQRQGLAQILVEPQRPRQSARNLRHLEGMRQAGAIMVAFMEDEYLGLVLQPAEGGGMDDAIAIAAEGIARRTRRLWMAP